MRQIVIIAHNLRSTHNVGSLLRTAEGLGVEMVYLTGYTPHPAVTNDQRLPHEVQKISRAIQKTALGAEATQHWRYEPDVQAVITQLKQDNYHVCAVEQTKTSTPLPDYHPTPRVALVLGREVEGIEPNILEQCDQALEIPMFGAKESYNVVQAAAMALYHCRFIST